MILFSPVSFLPSNVSVGEKRAKQRSPNIWMENKCKVSQELNVSFQYPHFWHFAVCICIQAGILKYFVPFCFISEHPDLGYYFFLNIPQTCTWEGNGNPLQYSCLENPMDGGAWWAAICGVAQSWTHLKRLSSSSNHVRLFVIPRTIEFTEFSRPEYWSG